MLFNVSISVSAKNFPISSGVPSGNDRNLHFGFHILYLPVVWLLVNSKRAVLLSYLLGLFIRHKFRIGDFFLMIAG